MSHFFPPEPLIGPTERMVVAGLRRWTSANAVGGKSVSGPFQGALTDAEARAATAALEDFAAALDLCVACPLRGAGANPDGLTRDETLILGLVSAIQNGDGATAETCLRALTCVHRCDTVALAAGAFALIMRGFGKTLRPIPARLIRNALSEPARGSRAAPARLH